MEEDTTERNRIKIPFKPIDVSRKTAHKNRQKQQGKKEPLGLTSKTFDMRSSQRERSMLS